MVEHILLMRWTEEASQEAIDNALAELRGLKGKIAGIIDLSCGSNFSERAKGYRHGAVMRFKDRARCKLITRTRSISVLCKALSIRFAPTL